MLNYKTKFREYSTLYTNYAIMSIDEFYIMKKNNWKCG